MNVNGRIGRTHKNEKRKEHRLLLLCQRVGALEIDDTPLPRGRSIAKDVFQLDNNYYISLYI